ncbi:hypothetical protein [Actinoplanes sp. GCM10030250]|uniref:hypothetical protein n=1 Tax=Actinoplanes sp. GCM10030250 TaxID=3273376 RepID=UPI00360C8AFB
MKPVCGAAELLRPGGPVRVPLRECCAAALIGVDAVTSGCLALETAEVPTPELSPGDLSSGAAEAPVDAGLGRGRR